MSGRWPANVILSPEMAGVLDQQSGTSKSVPVNLKRGGGILRFDGFHNIEDLRAAAERGDKCPNGRDARETLERAESRDTKQFNYSDEGGASRFFLTAGYEPWELKWILENGLRPCGSEEQ